MGLSTVMALLVVAVFFVKARRGLSLPFWGLSFHLSRKCKQVYVCVYVYIYIYIYGGRIAMTTVLADIAIDDVVAV